MSRSTLTVFLLIMSFGILFAGCRSPEPDASFEEFTFSDDELEQVEELAKSSSSVSSSGTFETEGDNLTGTYSVSGQVKTGTSTTVLAEGTTTVTPNKENQALYDTVRLSVGDGGANIYRVNNAFLNVRQSMNVTSVQVARLDQGEALTVLEIPNAEWAKVRLRTGAEGYVAVRYIAKVTTEERLPLEKKQFEGKYFVDFQFLNIRKDPSAQSVKIGELPGRAIITPLSNNGEWARVSFEGKEGYASAQYLKPFLPVFLVRQETFDLPILQYYADDTASIASIPKHVEALKAALKRVSSLSTLRDTILAQESKDVRIPPNTVVIVISSVNSKNIGAVSSALQAAAVGATLFIQTKDIGLSGITEKMALTLMANGNELLSGGHTGDDLRSKTDSEVALELGQSKKLLEELTNKEVYAFLFPGGGVNDRIMQQAREMGYLFGVSQSPDRRFSRSQFLRLPTLLVSSGMSAEDIVRLTK